MSDTPELLDAEIAGQKLKITGEHATLIITVLSFTVTCLIAWALFQHLQDMRDGTRDFVAAIKEQTVTIQEASKLQREQNCLMSMSTIPLDRRNVELCRRLSQ